MLFGLTTFGQPHQKLSVLSALATFGEAHFLVYQSLNSLVSRDFLLDVLTFLLAVVSVSLVLKNSNKPIKYLILIFQHYQYIYVGD